MPKMVDAKYETPYVTAEFNSRPEVQAPAPASRIQTKSSRDAFLLHHYHRRIVMLK